MKPPTAMRMACRFRGGQGSRERSDFGAYGKRRPP
jgi:hypothetical protein